MKRTSLGVTGIAFLFLSIAVGLSNCGGGGGGSVNPTPTPPVLHPVTITWAPNHESGVNTAGGGYQVSISGQPMIIVPWVSGLSTAPTSTTVSLSAGNYTVTVRAYAALDKNGGTTGSFSAYSSQINVIVPQ